MLQLNPTVLDEARALDVERQNHGSRSPLQGTPVLTYNPYDVRRSPAASSGGTGAAACAMMGFGTDTGGSVRMPSSANGIAGLKPTLGPISRDGIVPLALSFDTAGPMARLVHDTATTLSVVAGVDPADPATARSALIRSRPRTLHRAPVNHRERSPTSPDSRI